MDLENAEYALFMGSFPGANSRNFQSIAKRCAARVKSGELQVDVLDPVLGNGCVTPSAEGINWIPIKVGTNAAFSLGLMRWIMDHDGFDKEYLSFANQASAFAAGWASFTNSPQLVIADESHKNYGKLMVASDAGIEEPALPEGTTTTPTYHVVIDTETGQPALHSVASRGQIEYEGEVNGVKVRSSYLYIRDNVYEHTIEEYAEMCEVPVETIERVAEMLVKHAPRVGINAVGATAATNGTDTTFAFYTLRGMLGVNQMIGGACNSRNGAKTTADGAAYKLSTVKGGPGITTKNATYIARTGKSWYATDEYKARVAAGEKDPAPKLPWYPAGSGGDGQALMSIVNGYPYRPKILVTWMAATITATPGALRDSVIERLCDPDYVPLHIVCDVVVGEHAQYADYIVPDTTPYESWGVNTQEGYWGGKGNEVRWPVVEPETIEISGGRHASWEAFLIDVAKELELPGFGEDAIEAVDGTKYPLNDACDYFIKAVANLAYSDDPVADISDEDIQTQALDELPETWKSCVSEAEWPKVLNVMSRGGRFWPIEESIGKDAGHGPRSAYASAKTNWETYVYSEKKGSYKNAYAGTYTSGAMKQVDDTFADGTFMTDTFDHDEYPFGLCNYKAKFRSVTMQSNNPIMQQLCEHNYLEINLEDAAELGIKDGDMVKATAATGDVITAEAMVRAGVARHTFGMAWGYGHRAYGAQDVEIDGEMIKGDPAIGAGAAVETVMDTTLGDDIIFPVADNDTGSPGRNGGMFKIEKA